MPTSTDRTPLPTHLPPLRPASPEVVDGLADAVGVERVSVAPLRRLDASRDQAWLSPILSAAMPEHVADVVVTPRDETDVALTLAIAHRHGVAVTARGDGTGTCGQAVPLAGGIVIDLADINGVVDVGRDWVVARAGTSFARLEAAAREAGRELAILPSTVGGTLGGFLAGGDGGSGSIENGFVGDGFVDGLELLPCWAEPTPVIATGRAVRPHLRANGTTGVIVRARVALRPARPWAGYVASFDRFDDAVAAGRELLALRPQPRNLCIDDGALVELLPLPAPTPAAGTVSLRAIVEASTVPAWLTDPDAVPLLASLSFDNVVLAAKRTRPELCHLRVAGPALVERHDEVRASLPGAMLHLDAAAPGGVLGFGGLLLSRFVDAETLHDGMARLRSLGVQVTDPHTWMLDADPERDEVARHLDPHGLLNPGKLPRDRTEGGRPDADR